MKARMTELERRDPDLWRTGYVCGRDLWRGRGRYRGWVYRLAVESEERLAIFLEGYRWGYKSRGYEYGWWQYDQMGNKRDGPGPKSSRDKDRARRKKRGKKVEAPICFPSWGEDRGDEGGDT